MSNKVPQIRFNGYSDAWVQRKLVDITTKIGSGKTPKGGSEVYQSNGIALLRSQNVTNDHVDMTDVAFISEEINNTMLGSEVQHNDVLLNITGASIGRSAVYKHTETANVNQHVSIIRLTQGFDPDFVQQLISSFQGQNQIQAFQAGGAREGLNFKQIGLMTFAFPSYDEQLKVSSVVSRLSDLIAANQRKLDLLKEQKKGYLQKMFPKNGTKVPELRFEGFADDWEERKLSDMANVKTGFPFKNENFVDDGQYLVITNGNIQNDSAFVDGKVGNRITAVTDEIKEKYTLNYGDILVTMDGTVGRTAKVVEGNQILAQRVGRLVSESTPEFIYQWLNTGKFFTEMTKVSHGGTIKHISLSEIGDYVAYVPTSKDEREKIGSLFLNIDKTITLHQRKLDLLKEQKKGFLQKMFV